MKYKTDEKTREATRERVKRYREKKATVTEPVTRSAVTVTPPVTQAEIDQLPSSLKYAVDAETRRRQVLKMPLEIKERQEMAVRRFRGY